MAITGRSEKFSGRIRLGMVGGGQGEHVVAAAVAASAFFERRLLGHGLLRDAGQRIVLAHDGNDRPARTETCDERRRHPGNASFHPEALLFCVVGQRVGGLVFLERRLSVFPDAIGQVNEIATVCIHRLHRGFLGGTHSRMQRARTAQAQQKRSHDAGRTTRKGIAHQLRSLQERGRFQHSRPCLSMRNFLL
jgi:hypothetical protein